MVRLTWAEYFRLCQEVTRTVREFNWDKTLTKRVVNLEDFVRSSKKECKQYWNILSGKRLLQYKLEDTKGIRSGRTLWGNFHVDMTRGLVK
jgi:hypothetical protein